MSKLTLVVCVLAVLVQVALSCGCGCGCGYGGGSLGGLGGGCCGCGGGSLGGLGGGCGCGCGCGGLGGSGVSSSGGQFVVTSYSNSAPTGISVISENQYEGQLCLSGNLPFLGIVALEGCVPNCGQGSVCYDCGDCNIGISERTCGCGCGCCGI